MKINTHLNFKGQCEEAFKFYERCLGGKIVTMMNFADSPMADQAPPGWRDKILHASLKVGNELVLMGADAPPDRYQEPKGFAISLEVKDPAEADRIFNALAEKGKIEMPIQQTFWSPRFGMLVDRFGTPWMVNCEGTAS